MPFLFNRRRKSETKKAQKHLTADPKTMAKICGESTSARNAYIISMKWLRETLSNCPFIEIAILQIIAVYCKYPLEYTFSRIPKGKGTKWASLPNDNPLHVKTVKTREYAHYNQKTHMIVGKTVLFLFFFFPPYFCTLDTREKNVPSPLARVRALAQVSTDGRKAPTNSKSSLNIVKNHILNHLPG